MRAILAAMLLIATPCAAWGQPSSQSDFPWPPIEADAIPDARFSEILQAARDAARNAVGRSKSGVRFAKSVRRREGLRSAFGKETRPIKVDAGTILTGFPYDTESGAMLGVMTYPDGASMAGLFGPDEGIFTPAPESSVSQFSGWVWGARTSKPSPMEGVFTMKNGDTFTGSLSGNSASGVYQASDGQRRFVGKFDVGHGSVLPEAGIMENNSGRLLAVFYPPEHPARQ